MRMYDLIEKKKHGQELTEEEIRFFVMGYTGGEIPDYQMSALLMAIYFKGLTEKETSNLTMAMAESGDTIDLSAIKGVKVDKHSTGGVGDKTTLIIAPMVAACGVPVAKMSGRGLGFTGGTIDKLESIPNFQTTISREEFFHIVNDIGVSVIGQSGNLAPADKKLYALRDVTATIDSLPLIASSIMSKKIAAGADCILLDVKTGSGAFMKTREESIALAEMMVTIGESVGRRTVALITDMNRPLGYAIGNSLEVMEAIDTLKGGGPADLTEVCLEIAANMLFLAGKGTAVECRKMAAGTIADGSALNKLIRMVEAQGGDASVIRNPEGFKKAKIIREIYAQTGGYVSGIHTEACGTASVVLGAGRETKESPIDYSAGIMLKVKLGDLIKAGDLLAVLHTSTEELYQKGKTILQKAIEISSEKPVIAPLIHMRITGEDI